MKKLCLLALALLFPLAVLAQALPPTDTVRQVSVPGAQNWCSAVVVRPDIAITVRHCLNKGLSIDGVTVEHITAAAAYGRDIAVLYAPGLKCPCAKIGTRPAAGDFVVAIGFPGAMNGVQHSVGTRIRLIGLVGPMAPYVDDQDFKVGTYLITDTAVLEQGDSGGGMFAVQDGEWRLVGVNAIGIPVQPFSQAEQGSGAVPVEFAAQLLPKD